MEETLATFETAVLAEEKGFDAYTVLGYEPDTGIETLTLRSDRNDIIYAPTQALLQKWLRDNHDCIVIVDWGPLSEKYSYEIYYKKRDMDGEYVNKSYEDALEAGLQHALNLI